MLLKCGTIKEKFQLMNFISKTVRQEIKDLAHNESGSVLQSHSSMESLQALKFDNFKVEMIAYCPLLWQVLLGAATRT